jgi:hypothetical protein
MISDLQQAQDEIKKMSELTKKFHNIEEAKVIARE